MSSASSRPEEVDGGGYAGLVENDAQPAEGGEPAQLRVAELLLGEVHAVESDEVGRGRCWGRDCQPSPRFMIYRPASLMEVLGGWTVARV